MDLRVDTDHDFILTLNPLTPKGDPATVQPGSVTWNVVSGDLQQQDVLFPEGDPNAGQVNEMKKKFITGALGQSIVEVTGDADKGEGVKTIRDNVNVTVDTPQAESLGLGVELVPKATV